MLPGGRVRTIMASEYMKFAAVVAAGAYDNDDDNDKVKKRTIDRSFSLSLSKSWQFLFLFFWETLRVFFLYRMNVAGEDRSGWWKRWENIFFFKVTASLAFFCFLFELSRFKETAHDFKAYRHMHSPREGCGWDRKNLTTRNRWRAHETEGESMGNFVGIFCPFSSFHRCKRFCT